MSEAKNNYAGGEKIASDDLNQISQNANDGGGFRDLIMGDAFTGTATPQASYQSASDNKLYICDGNDADKLNFLGFVLNTGSADDTADLQTEGIVRGFTGLVEGSYYYVQDDKTIGTSVGTYAVLVGIAISETELVILKEETRLVAVASDNEKIDADTERIVSGIFASGTLKELQMAHHGEIRITFDVYCTNSSCHIYLKDGKSIELASYNDTSWTSKSVDLTVYKGEIIRFTGDTSNTDSNAARIRNVSINYDLEIESLPQIVTDQSV